MEAVKRHVLENHILQAFRIKPFALMMLSEFFSQVAFNMQHFVLIFVIYGLTKSNTAVSGMILSFMIPAVLFSVISGVYVDRWDKKKVLLFTHLIRAVLILPFFIPNLHLALIYLFTFLIAVTTQFFVPAEYSIIPTLVPKKLLIPANAIFSFGIFAIMLIGYVLSGPILLLIGKVNTILLLMLLFILSAFIVAAIKVPNKKIKPNDQIVLLPSRNYSVLHEAKEIFVFIRRARRILFALLMITIAQAVIFIFAVLAPGYVATILEAPLESVSVVLVAPAGLGFAFGAMLFGSIGRKLKNHHLSSLGFIIAGTVFLLFPLASRVISKAFFQTLNYYLPGFLEFNNLHIIVVLAFIIGFAISIVFVPSNTTIQMGTSERMRGRMYGLLSALVGAVAFLPVIVAGGLADLLGVGFVIGSIGVLMILLGIIFKILD